MLDDILKCEKMEEKQLQYLSIHLFFIIGEVADHFILGMCYKVFSFTLMIDCHSRIQTIDYSSLTILSKFLIVHLRLLN